jgi:alpha-L-rhamnosidase
MRLEIPCLLLLSALVVAGGTAGSAARLPVKVSGLKAEYLTNPLGLDTPKPRLQWILESEERGIKQTAYQLLAATSEETLKKDRGDLWDSGKVASDRASQLPYGGKEPGAGNACWWKVRVWDQDGRASAWSAPAVWERGLPAKSDWRGKWIGRTGDTAQRPAPLLRREFTVKGKVKRARAYVCGLGYHELRLNGAKVGDHVLDPGYTRYDRRALYVTHDVTDQLKRGPNALGVMLGTGWTNVHTVAVWYFDKAPWRQAPKLLLDLRIEYADGRTETIVSDESWKTADGPVVYDSIYAGESYDARKELPAWDRPGFNDSQWHNAWLLSAPASMSRFKDNDPLLRNIEELLPPPGVVSAQEMEPIRITRTLKPVKLTEPKPGVFVFDIGQNLSGHVQLTVSGPAGTEITLKHGERLHPNGTLDQIDIAEHIRPFNAPGRPREAPIPRFQTDVYTLKGSGVETWEPRFVYHGFQYVEVTGFPSKPTLESIKARVTHTDVQAAGDFACSNPLLNRIQEASKWAYLSNLASIPTDCPHREKNGWTGDAHLAAEQAIYNYHPAAAYKKWIQDLADEMRPTGELPGIVPSSGWGYEWGNGPAWDSAFVLIPWYLYEYYGDREILARHYVQMRRYVDYLTGKSREGIVSIGLGDWVPPGKTAPTEVTSTGYYFADAQIVARSAEILGNKADAAKYKALADSIRAAFNKRFLQPDTAMYSNGTQTALATPLNWNLVPAEYRQRVVDHLVAEVEKKNGHLDTGILGTKYLLNVLLDNGRADVAYRVASQRTYPSWGLWIEQGATTLWEAWDGSASRNHIMFGDISAWFYRALAGIRPDAPGFKRIRIQPQLVGDLTWARASYDSIHGRIATDWKRESGLLTLNVTIPPNTTATVYVPTKDGSRVTEGGKPAGSVEGIKLLRSEAGATVYEVGSGKYRFVAPQ